MGHQPNEAKASRGFGGAQPGGGRPAKPRAVDVLRERIEADIDSILDPLMAQARAGDLVAIREVLDRGYGKPKQTSEISGPDGGPLTIEALAAKAIEP